MFFLVNFSFDEIGADQSVRHGYFDIILASVGPDEILTPETAKEKIKEYLRSLKPKTDIFENVKNIYLDDLIEIKEISTMPVMIRFQSSLGSVPESTSWSFPMGEKNDLISYVWNTGQEHTILSKNGERATDPFLNFNE